MGNLTKYVVIAMNHVLGTSYARHHQLPLTETVIITTVDEVQEKVGGYDMDQIGIFVANDRRGFAETQAIFNKLVETCTVH